MCPTGKFSSLSDIENNPQFDKSQKGRGLYVLYANVPNKYANGIYKRKKY